MDADINTNWSHSILICRKCVKRQKSDFGKVAMSALREASGTGKQRKRAFGVVKVPCLDVCPKDGVVVVDTRTPHRWHIVRSDADIFQLVTKLK